MPYIPAEQRTSLDEHINKLVERITLDHPNKRSGRCNYVITRILLNALKPVGGWTYQDLQNVHGVLDCASKEIYAKLTRPYEEKSMLKNGNLLEFEDVVD